MSWRLAKSLIRLREQINAAYPNRDKASDGSIGNDEHAARKSDHNPNAAGVVTAIDIDRELGGQRDGSNDGATVASLVAMLQFANDPRIKYIIWNGRITVKGDIRQWKKYDGANAHKHHCHISVSADARLYDDGGDWHLIGAGVRGDLPEQTSASLTSVGDIAMSISERDLKFGDKGADVRALQVKLKITVDGDFGKSTKAALMEFQKANGLDVDGICGKNTRLKLGL